jgi:DNA-nicking Smr family endonuclease
MSPRGKSLSDSDRAVWAGFAQAVRPLPGRALPAPPARAPAAVTLQAPPEVPLTAARPARGAVPLVTGHHPAGLDKSSWRRFSSGRVPAARTLDLHGKTAQAAYHALDHFLRTAHAERLRCVEVITGRGSGEHGGVIRRELPFWLNSPSLRPLVLAAAHPHAANPGSTRILLRRKSS